MWRDQTQRILPGVREAETRYPFDLSITPRYLKRDAALQPSHCALEVLRFSSITSSAEYKMNSERCGVVSVYAISDRCSNTNILRADAYRKKGLVVGKDHKPNRRSHSNSVKRQIIMGNDGGTKALMKKYSRWGVKKEVAHYEPEEVIQGKWSTCALSGEALQSPVWILRVGED